MKVRELSYLENPCSLKEVQVLAGLSPDISRMRLILHVFLSSDSSSEHFLCKFDNEDHTVRKFFKLGCLRTIRPHQTSDCSSSQVYSFNLVRVLYNPRYIGLMGYDDDELIKDIFKSYTQVN